MTELDAEQIKEAVKDGVADAHAEARVFGFARLVRAYAAQPEPEFLRRRRRNMEEADDDAA